MAESEEDDESESEVEQMVAESMRKSAKVQMKDAEVYTTTVVHPLTGRKLFVSVAGIEPRDLAEMNLLGSSANSGGASHPSEPFARPDHSASQEHPNRPDRSARPASNRPDHFYRPESNRPEHTH